MELKAGFRRQSLAAIAGLSLLVLTACGEDAVPIIAPSFIEVVPQAVDFGQAPIGNSIRKELIVRNTGKSTLDVKGVSFRGDTSAFSLQKVPGEIDANDKKSAIIEFRPDEAGEFFTKLLIESDADNNKAIEIIIRGVGIDNTLCGDCNMPPQNVCITAFDLEVYDLIGACVGAECNYRKRVIPCEERCASGACVKNEVPLVSISLSPIPAYTDNDLTLSATASDANGDPVSLSYEWFKNQVQEPNETAARLSAARTAKGEEWMVTVTPNDGQVDGPQNSIWTTILNSVPVIATATVSPSAGNQSTTFTCTAQGTTDADQDNITYSYQWTVNSMASVATPTIDGASFKRGDILVCTITPNDGEEDGRAVSSAPITIENSLASIAVVLIGPPSPNELTTVTATISGWMDADGDAPQYRYAWWVNSSMVSSASSIDGTLFRRGDMIELVVTPFDGMAEGQAVGSNQLTVGNSVPSLANVTLLPMPAYATDDLFATPTGWYDADGDAESYAYEWYVNSSSVTGVNGSTLSSANFTRGDQVYVKVTPSDGIDSGASVQSALLTIGNSVPSITSASINPGAGNETTTFTCVPDGWSDADGDSEDYTYQWYLNSTFSVTTASIDGTTFDRGDRIRCEVTPYDGTNSGSPQSSGTVLIANAPPSIAGVSITPTAGNETSTYSCVANGWMDADGDNPVYVYQWFVNGNAASTTSSITGAIFNRDDQLRCEITPNDVIDNGLTVSSSTITVQNSAPSITAAVLNPNPAYTNTNINVIPSGWYDADGDTESYAYQWYVNGQWLLFAMTDTLNSGNYRRGDHVYARVIPTDGTLGTAVATATLTISNSVPSIASATINPPSGNENSTFTCIAGGWNDADGDAQGYDYVWTVNTSSVATTATINGNEFNRSDDIQCIITPKDGIDHGAPQSSGIVTIGNAPPTITSASINPSSGTEETVFTCSASGWFDPDADPEGYDYQWYVNGNAATATASIDGNSFNRDQQIRCEVRGNDGLGGISAFVSSSTVTIQNTPPTAPTTTITPSNPTASQDLNCAILTASDDVDSDNVSYSYEWSNGSGSYTGATLTSTHTSIGDNWTCTITPNDGTINGAAGQAVVNISEDVALCSSLSFDGADDHVVIPASTDWDFANGDFTIELWFYPRSTNRQALFAFENDYRLGIDFNYFGTQNVNIWASSTGTEWNLLTADGAGNGTGSTSLALNQWHHIAYVRSGDRWILFVDGRIDVDVNVPGSVVTRTEDIRWGRWGDGPQSFGGRFDGLYDAVRISSNARYTANFIPVRNLGRDVDTLGRWTLSEGAGAIANDSSSNGHHGSINGGATWRDVCANNPAGLDWVYSAPADLDFMRTEVTIAQYAVCLAAGGCSASNHTQYTGDTGGGCHGAVTGNGFDDHPMHCMNGDGAIDFCAWAGGRLPAQSEWYAEASNNGSRTYPWGEATATCDYCVMEDPPTAGSFFGGCGTNTTWPVCSKPLGDSVSGLCDMAGNVAEWTTTPWQQPAGPGLFAQVGSHWYSYSYADLMASGARMIGTMNQFSYMGFRCVRDIAPFARYYEAETDLLHQVGRQEGTAWSANTIADTAEHMAYGPYARDWPETTLTVTFRLMIDVVNNNPEQVVSIDVFDSTAGQVLADRGLLRNEFNQNFVYQDFTLTVDMTGRGGNAMEARVYWNDTSYVRLDYIFVAE